MVAFFLAPLYILINVYLLHWIFAWLAACHPVFTTLAFRAGFLALYVILASSLLTAFLVKKPLWLQRLLKHISNYFLGTFLYLLMVILLADGLRRILKYGFHVTWIQSRTAFVLTGAICAALIFFFSIYGILHVQDPKVQTYNISIHKKCGHRSALTVVLLADTHFGYSITDKDAKKIAAKVNAQNPDLICFAGDIFDNNYDSIEHPERIAKALRSMTSTYGTYACWGNHDLNEPILAGFTFGKTHPDYEDPRMEQFLQDADISLLNDQSTLIDDAFYLVGRKDFNRAAKMENGRKTPSELLSSLDLTKPVLVMDHQPKELQELADAGVDLDLCGHTHDGQLFPGNVLTNIMWENSCGYLTKTASEKARTPGSTMHNIVTSGVGIWGPSMRIGTDSELCVIQITFD